MRVLLVQSPDLPVDLAGKIVVLVQYHRCGTKATVEVQDRELVVVPIDSIRMTTTYH